MKFTCPLIVVKDITISRNFYENILGQRVKYDFGEDIQFEGDFSIHLERHFQGLLGEGYQILKKAHNFELYFETEELDSIIQKLKANEVEVIHDVKEQPWGQRVARVYDPDYHIIEIGESIDSVILRYHRAGFLPKDIHKKTSMPMEVIKQTISQKV